MDGQQTELKMERAPCRCASSISLNLSQLLTEKFAIISGNRHIVAELLESGFDIDDGTVDSDQRTALEVAAFRGQLDIVRLLLNRGASQDHSDLLGWSPSLLCWFRRDIISGVDISNALSEYALQDKIVDRDGSGYLHVAAFVSGAAEIHYLIRLGLDNTGEDLQGLSPLNYAVYAGNLATYFALLSNHAVADGIGNHSNPLLHAAIIGKRDWDQRQNRWWAGLMDQESIIRDLLHRGIDPGTTNAPGQDRGFPESVKGLSITAQQLAAACGSATEAWYMSILRDCGLLDNEEEISRLRHLDNQGYVSRGHVIGKEESAPEESLGQEGVHDDQANQDDGSEV